MAGVPADDGFYLPADWYPHARCCIAWPFRPDAWGPGFEHACLDHAALARVIAQFEPVTLLVHPALEKEARLQVGRGVEIQPVGLDDSWIRDTGPAFLVDEAGAVAGVGFRFNGWGNRVHGYANDAALPGWLTQHLELPLYDCPLTIEGGAIQVDGSGTMIATGSTVLNDNRNPTLDRQQVEERLALYLGVSKVIWLEDVPADDPAEGEACNLVRFCSPARVLCAAGDERLDELHERLAGERDALGRRLEVLKMPQPGVGNDRSVQRSYLNFYLGNGVVVVPAFDLPSDGLAQEILQEAFPGRLVMPCASKVLPLRGMGFHSITRPVPGK